MYYWMYRKRNVRKVNDMTRAEKLKSIAKYYLDKINEIECLYKEEGKYSVEDFQEEEGFVLRYPTFNEGDDVIAVKLRKEILPYRIFIDTYEKKRHVFIHDKYTGSRPVPSEKQINAKACLLLNEFYSKGHGRFNKDVNPYEDRTVRKRKWYILDWCKEKIDKGKSLDKEFGLELNGYGRREIYYSNDETKTLGTKTLDFSKDIENDKYYKIIVKAYLEENKD